ncbi:MAG: cytochrome C [Deltaproteobacteria bacterium]
MENRAKSSKKANQGGWIFLLLGFIGALVVGWGIFPMVLYSKQPQPINFSHAVHLNPDKVDGIEGDTEAERCEYCHEFRDDGTFVGIPKLSKCTECHDDPESPMGDSPEEVKFLKNYVAEELPPYQANRLTGYSINIWGKRISGYKKHTWDRMKMDDCAECHTKMGHEENNACFVCHK